MCIAFHPLPGQCEACGIGDCVTVPVLEPGLNIIRSSALKYSGLSRSRLYELLSERKIRSICVKSQKGAARGVRLIDRESIVGNSGQPQTGEMLKSQYKSRPLANHGTPWRYSKTAHRCDTRRHGRSGDHQRGRRRAF